MPKTSEILYRCCFDDTIPPIPVIADYFGNARSEEQVRIILGIYQGLVKIRGVEADVLNNCFESNRLNELVHAKYKYSKTGYYKMFCDQDIDLFMLTCLEPIDEKDYLPIYDDNYCPNCETEGYYTEELKSGVDCSRCFKMLCSNCQSCGMLCITCDIGGRCGGRNGMCDCGGGCAQGCC